MKDPTETEDALAAMKRAAVIARERAARFGSKLVLWKDGAVVLVDPESSDAESGEGGDRTQEMAEVTIEN